MPKSKIKIEVEPIGKRFFIDEPANCLKSIQDAGIEIKSVCGGKGTCGKCRIMFMNGSANEPNEQELKILSKEEIEHGVRLACQHEFTEDTTIYIPASSLSEEQKLQVIGQERDIKIEPVVNKYYLKLERATLKDVKADFNRIKDSLKSTHSITVDNIDFRVLREMPKILRENNWEITVSVRNKEIILIEGKDTTDKSYGIAVDLGTTKIAVLLVDLLSGKTIDKKGVMNPQISFGEDVMSRIDFASEDDMKLKQIQQVVIDAINEAIVELCNKNGLKVSEILEMTLVGNTAMHHLFLGLPVRQLGLSPFPALTNDSIDLKAREVGINIATGGYIYLMPVVAGFIGSDHIAMILATGLYNMEGNCIGIDIGTNTEIALISQSKLYSVSTASGPAFEGAHIRYGMRAAPGAIERVIIDPQTCVPKIQTIDDKDPVGICGSGILDAIAELLKANIIDKRGKFKLDSGCICKDNLGNLQYVLLPSYYEERINNNQDCGVKNKQDMTQKDTAQNSDTDMEELKKSLCPCDDLISINQKDIVEIQLAKGAMRTGIEILLENAKIDFKDIDKIIIAGAFGSYIDTKNVINIGMFPNVPLKKISQVGNAASIGAKMALISKTQRKIAEDIGRMDNYLELTVFPTFSDHFALSVSFPSPEEII
ncbi:MAG: ASKHA domain-containing protein [Actinobacteria bacterium]|nr:ASKHA domain-containing protein [Actinomycetota bacterium]